MGDMTGAPVRVSVPGMAIPTHYPDKAREKPRHRSPRLSRTASARCRAIRPCRGRGGARRPVPRHACPPSVVGAARSSRRAGRQAAGAPRAARARRRLRGGEVARSRARSSYCRDRRGRGRASCQLIREHASPPNKRRSSPRCSTPARSPRISTRPASPPQPARSRPSADERPIGTCHHRDPRAGHGGKRSGGGSPRRGTAKHPSPLSERLTRHLRRKRGRIKPHRDERAFRT